MISYTTLNLDLAEISKTVQSRCQLPLTSEANSVPRILRGGRALVLIRRVITTDHNMGPTQSTALNKGGDGKGRMTQDIQPKGLSLLLLPGSLISN